jgi:hypothetical protein
VQKNPAPPPAAATGSASTTASNPASSRTPNSGNTAPTPKQ